MKEQYAWQLNIGTVLEIYDLAIKRGKKPGDSVEEEFFEILKQKRDKFKLLGKTDKDIDLLTGDLREAGLKILNMKEIDRREKNDQ